MILAAIVTGCKNMVIFGRKLIGRFYIVTLNHRKWKLALRVYYFIVDT